MLPGVSPDIYAATDFREISRLAYEEAGIVLGQAKAMLVYSRLAPRVRETGSTTFSGYIDRLHRDDTEKARAIAALTTNHTFFYREPHHFEHFASHVRPNLLTRLRDGSAVRLWSAGCSSGEETWSLVFTLLGPDRSEGTRIAGQNIRILASDIAPHALKRAAAAIYPAKELEAVPAALRQPWLTPQGTDLALADVARNLVRFRALNLQGEWPMRRRFDVIFCRNVMIYFDADTKERLLARFCAALQPGGYLYIGHSERVTGVAASELEPVGPTIYRRRGA
ncbi:MAG: protein-glutamate O-methyltransferase [Novosphingobium sp.]